MAYFSKFSRFLKFIYNTYNILFLQILGVHQIRIGQCFMGKFYKWWILCKFVLWHGMWQYLDMIELHQWLSWYDFTNIANLKEDLINIYNRSNNNKHSSCVISFVQKMASVHTRSYEYSWGPATAAAATLYKQCFSSTFSHTLSNRYHGKINCSLPLPLSFPPPLPLFHRMTLSFLKSKYEFNLIPMLLCEFLVIVWISSHSFTDVVRIKYQ